MRQPNRQAFPLRRWRSRQPRKTDPHYSARGVLKPEVARYISECYQNSESPELFLTAWMDAANDVVTFGPAVPYEYTARDHVPDLDDQFQ